MKLSPEAIKEFKAIYYKEYGVKLSDADAQEMARNLLTLFQAIARPLPRGEYDKTCPFDHREFPSQSEG